MSGKRATNRFDSKITSNQDLLDFVDGIPIGEGYERSAPDQVIPMDIHEVFKLFFANDAIYTFDKALEDIGQEFFEQG